MVWMMVAVVIYPLDYWVVVTKAATDNLTELMAGGGTIRSAFLLSICLGLISTGGTWLATLIDRGRAGFQWVGLLGLIVSIPFGFLAISYGTEDILLKYGQVFSALQFLLSSDRTSYVHGQELILRYIIVHAAAIGVIMLVQYCVLMWFFGKPRENSSQESRQPTAWYDY